MDIKEMRRLLNYEIPTQEQYDRHCEVNKAAVVFMQTVMKIVPKTPDSTLLFRAVQDAVVHARMAIDQERLSPAVDRLHPRVTRKSNKKGTTSGPKQDNKTEGS